MLALAMTTGCPTPSGPPTSTTTTSTTTSTTTTTVPAWIPANTCFDGTTTPDITYEGPEDTANNATGWSSSDGSCSGSPIGQITIVLADDQATADAKCADLTPAQPVGVNVVGTGLVFTPAFPSDAWQCFFPPV